MDESFRQAALKRLTDAFGPPQVLRVDNGEIYRWRLDRPHQLNVALYVTLDSPEMPNIAHVLVSDPLASAIDPIASLTIRTLDELDVVIDRIKKQWKRTS